MRKLAFTLKAVMYFAAFGGCILGAIGCVPLAISNAEWDYYHQTHRQLAGWLTCFAPMIAAFCAAALHLIKSKNGRVRTICLFAAFICSLPPVIYMVIFDFSLLNMAGSCMLFAFVLIGLTVKALVHENIIAEQEGEDFGLLTEEMDSELV